MSSVLNSISAQGEHCTKVVSYVLFSVLGVETTLGSQILADLMIKIHWQGEVDHDIFYMLLFVQKSRIFLAQSLLLSRTEVMCWLSHFG